MIPNLQNIEFIYFDGGSVLFNRKTLDGDNIAKLLNFKPSEYNEILNKVIELQSKEESQKFMSIRTIEQEYSYLEKFHELMCKTLGVEYNDSLIRQLTEFRIKADFEIHKGVLSTLNILKNHGYKLGVLSNALPSRRYHELKIDGLINYFDVVVISWEIGYHKPDEDIYKYAIGKAGVSTDKILFIDDKASYLDGAKKSGITHLIQMVHSENTTNHYPKIKNLDELPNLLGIK